MNAEHNHTKRLYRRPDSTAAARGLAGTLFTGALLFILLLPAASMAQQGNLYVRKGNKAYENKDYKEAESDYQKALQFKSAAVKGKFNMGDAYFRQGQYDKAVDAYKQALSLTKDKTLTSHAYHNIGNCLMEQKKYDESIRQYENSLLNNPSDDDTRYNLAYAQDKLQQQKQQQQQKKDDKQQQQQQKQQQQQQQQQKKDDKQQQQQQQNINQQDAQRILDALNNDEKNLQAQMQKKKVNSKQGVIEKNW